MGKTQKRMNRKPHRLSVMDIAGICGVARSTVSYWIAEKSLPSSRSGKRFMVRVEDLMDFLEAEGHPIPGALLDDSRAIHIRSLKAYKACWEYWRKDPHREGCKGCPVSTHALNACFTARRSPGNRCSTDCPECSYFHEYHAPCMSFIHQINNPAAIYKDLYIWSGNSAWADLCGVATEDLIGAGAEEFIHPESLKNIIDYDRKTRLGRRSEVLRLNLFFTSRDKKKIKTDLSLSPLKDPDGTWLAVVERQYPALLEQSFPAGEAV
jgi:excisionase family DNA binding protein